MGRMTRRIYKSTVGVLNTYGRRKMAGEVFSFAGSTPPSGSLLCNGALISRTTYANLFAAIGILYGAGDGVTTFAIPDYRGEFPRFADVGRGVDAARAVGSAQAGQNAAHSHNGSWGDAFAYISNDLISPTGTSSLIINALGAVHMALTNQNGGNESRPRNVALLPCIYY
jgi:microcystin-dependent protein